MSSTNQEHTKWTAAAGGDQATETYEEVRKALADLDRRHSIEIFLQGSYANQTNIRVDSDVDVVVKSNCTWSGSWQQLSPIGIQRYDALGTANYGAIDLRRDVTLELQSHFGSHRVHPKNKCIRVDKVPGYVDADAVPCLQYRLFTSANPDFSREFIEGIAIFPRDGGMIVNFPKQHIKNGQDKNQATGKYKATVRQMKHLRNRAVDEGRIQKEVAPGYLLECMTYNVPNPQFVSDDSQRLLNVVSWLRENDKSGFMSCDGIHRLFVDDPGGFEVSTVQRIANALWEAY